MEEIDGRDAAPAEAGWLDGAGAATGLLGATMNRGAVSKRRRQRRVTPGMVMRWLNGVDDGGGLVDWCGWA